MKSILLIAAGGAIGSVARYLIGLLAKHFYAGSFPLGTFVANVCGCFIIGLVYAWAVQQHSFENIRLFVMIGLLGGFTTFSGFGLEMLTLANDGRFGTALGYFALSNILCVGAVAAGYYLLNNQTA